LDLNVGHLVAAKWTDVPTWAPLSLQTFFDVAESALLFCEPSVTLDSEHVGRAPSLLRSDDVGAATEQLRLQAVEEIEFAEYYSDERQEALSRLNDLRVIGWSACGDPLVLDSSVQDIASESAVRLLDHDSILYSIGPFDPDGDDPGPCRGRPLLTALPMRFSPRQYESLTAGGFGIRRLSTTPKPWNSPQNEASGDRCSAAGLLGSGRARVHEVSTDGLFVDGLGQHGTDGETKKDLVK
jgi:hypothetical protein